jgi:flagellar biosynthesis protein FlhB
LSDSKPFDPTQSRIDRARREGDVPRATELGSVASFAGAVVVLVAASPAAVNAALAALGNAARGITEPAPYVMLAAYATAASLSGAAAAITATSFAVGGIRMRPPTPAAAKLDPVAGIRRMLSRDAVTAGLRAAFAATAASAALVPALRDAFIGSLAGATPAALCAVALHAVERSVAIALAVGVAFGASDALVERVKWRRRLRMTFDEMRRDLKQNEGDPILRNRRRAQHRALVRGSMSRLAEAAFVVANPTHIAVALEYRPPDVTVPRVLVRAIDEGARVVKMRARELRIPIVEDRSLARRLLAATEVGAYIPRDCYMAVAQIVAALIHEGALA